MGWVHDTGYDPAYAHEGWVARVLDDGIEDIGGTLDKAEADARTVGWRAACECGWRGATFYPRAEFPSEGSFPPEEVDGWENSTGCSAEWAAHLADAVPDLEVHDAALAYDEARERLDRAIARARAGGVPWSTIGRLTGMTRQSAWERWGETLTGARRGGLAQAD